MPDFDSGGVKIDPKPPAEVIPEARLAMLEGRDHLRAPAERRFKEVVTEFLRAAP